MGGLGAPEIIIVLAIFSIPLFIVALIINYLRSAGRRRERLAAIEKGVAFSPMADASTLPEARIYLLRGLIWLCVGIALTLALLGISLTSKQPAYQRLSAGIIDGTEPGNRQAANNIPMEYSVPPWVSFIGFIPIGVGIAYLSFHRMEARREKGV